MMNQQYSTQDLTPTRTNHKGLSFLLIEWSSSDIGPERVQEHLATIRSFNEKWNTLNEGNNIADNLTEDLDAVQHVGKTPHLNGGLSDKGWNVVDKGKDAAGNAENEAMRTQSLEPVEPFIEVREAASANDEKLLNYPWPYKALSLSQWVSASWLESEVEAWIKKQQHREYLLLIYYVGFTDKDLYLRPPLTRTGEKLENFLREHGGLNWRNILAKVVETDRDVLLLFTCSSGHQAQMTRLNLCNKLHALVSSSYFVKRSCGIIPFSSESLVQGLGLNPNVFGDVSVTRVHYRLRNLRQKIIVAPVWNDQQREHPLVKLKARESSPPSLPPRPASFSGFKFVADSDLGKVGWWKVLQRLKDEMAPGGEPIPLTLLLDYIGKVYEVLSGASTDVGARNIFMTFSAQAREELQDGWHDFIRQVSTEPTVRALLKHYKAGAKKSDEAVDDFQRQGWGRVLRLMMPLRRNLNINLMAAPRLNEVEALQKAALEHIFQDLRFTEFIKLRLLAHKKAPASISLEVQQPTAGVRHATKPMNMWTSPILRSVSSLGIVLVERKYYAPSHGQEKQHMRIAAKRVQKLASALGLIRVSAFKNLHCVGWFHEPARNRFTLGFATPEGVSGQPISMYEMMTRPGFLTNPPLGKCYAIALAIGEAIQRWHIAGWVHRRITSQNIVFFLSPDGSKVLWDDPYLCGFEFARPDVAPSSSPFVQNFFVNVYNHPEQQGEPTQQHRKEHDFYSFGVILCEIAVWTAIEHVFQGVDAQTLSPARMQQMILNWAEQWVGHHMGKKYLRSVVTCLTTSFGITEDDAVDTRLLKAFDRLVLRNLEDCLMVD